MKWTERYGCFHASVGKRAIDLSVAWKSARGPGDYENPGAAPAGYEVSVLNRRLKARFKDAEEAKTAAIKLAKKIVDEIAAELAGEGA